ncbi:MAG: response regulator [candidate division Zixibacteria bacterium]|nr:response regulator [candidate division Zixibacteria bacterium]
MHREPCKRILVVDDEKYICRIIVESLSQQSYDIVSLTDPREALQYVANNPVDLVLTDLVMGEYSGVEVLETTLENHSDAVVILMTAHPTVQTAISVLKRGAYDFLVKPFKLELLKATVTRGLAHQKVLRDNLSLKGQVEFLKVANAFFATGMDIDGYLEMVLRSCNTELAAVGSAVIELDPHSNEVSRWVCECGDDSASDKLIDDRLLFQFEGARSATPVIASETVTIDGSQMYELLISKPILIRKSLNGVINVLVRSRTDQIPHGRLDVLSILAGSAASAMANHELHRAQKKSYMQAIRALANAIEARDTYTAGHTDRVTRLAELIARHLGWNENQIQNLQVGSMLHDIGKIGVPDSILNKVSRLTDEERANMMVHPEVGLRIIRDIDLFKPSIPYILAHHERYDGNGYPRGLKGEQIPIEGRLLAVADTFDAIMSDRPYRDGAGLEFATRELIQNKGTQFDPGIVDAFLQVLLSGQVDFMQLYGRDEDSAIVESALAKENAAVPA